MNLILLVFAFVCAVIAVWAATQPDPLWKRCIAAAIAFLIAAELFGGWMAYTKTNGHVGYNSPRTTQT